MMVLKFELKMSSSKLGLPPKIYRIRGLWSNSQDKLEGKDMQRLEK